MSDQSNVQRPVSDSTQRSQETDIHGPGGIRNRNPSKQAPAEPHIRPSGRWDRRMVFLPSLEWHSAKMFHCIIRLKCITLPIVSFGQNVSLYYPYSVLTLPIVSFGQNVPLYYPNRVITLPRVSFDQNVPFTSNYIMHATCHAQKRTVNIFVSKCNLHPSSFPQNYNLKILPLRKTPTHHFEPKITLTFPVILRLRG
jgi:hypothetical protein